MITAKTTRQYWDRAESNRRPRAFDPDARGLRYHAQRQWGGFLRKSVDGTAKRGRLLELGCGGSVLLPYFRTLGFEVSGIDYSESGCRLAAEICKAHDCAVNIICGDVFEPPAGMSSQYDVVVSFGLAEHFTDAIATIAAFSRFLAPGGTMITTVPNMAGWAGTLQRLFDPRIFEGHVPLTRDELVRAHSTAGLSIVEAGFFQAINFGVVNPGTAPSRLKRAAFDGLRVLTAVGWAWEEWVTRLPANRFTSPYIYCVARGASA